MISTPMDMANNVPRYGNEHGFTPIATAIIIPKTNAFFTGFKFNGFTLPMNCNIPRTIKLIATINFIAF
jgi:hypothetical protein